MAVSSGVLHPREAELGLEDLASSLDYILNVKVPLPYVGGQLYSVQYIIILAACPFSWSCVTLCFFPQLSDFTKFGMTHHLLFVLLFLQEIPEQSVTNKLSN